MNLQKKYFLSLFYVVVICIIFFTVPHSTLALEAKYPVIPGNVNLNTTSSPDLPDYAKYLFDLGMIIGFAAVFISIIISGTAYLLSPFIPGSSLLGWAKDRFSGAISGLLILICIYLVIVTINPALVGFKAELPPLQDAQTNTSPGIYFYSTADCTGNDPLLLTTKLAHLGNFDNRTKGIRVVHDTASGDRYIGILYGDPEYKGKCLYILPNPDPARPVPDCQTPSDFGTSASVYKYEYNPNGDGVYFYRKSSYNPEGGYLKVSNQQIEDGIDGDVFQKHLEEMKYIDPALVGPDNLEGCTVPEEERFCDGPKDAAGKCPKDQQRCPTLSGENISSIEIRGKYLVLFLHIGYQSPELVSEGPWSHCQEFPSPDDAHGTGPTQIKWHDIRKDPIGLPNAVIVLPIKK